VICIKNIFLKKGKKSVKYTRS